MEITLIGWPLVKIRVSARTISCAMVLVWMVIRRTCGFATLNALTNANRVMAFAHLVITIAVGPAKTWPRKSCGFAMTSAFQMNFHVIITAST